MVTFRPQLLSGCHVVGLPSLTPPVEDTRKHSEAATTTISPEPRPSADHSSASDLATSASDGVQRDAAAASQDVAAALADGPVAVASVARGRQREER